MVSFLDYFPEEKTLVFLDELNHLAENGEGVEEEYVRVVCTERKKARQIFRSSGYVAFRNCRRS